MSSSVRDKEFLDAELISLQDWLDLLFDQEARKRYNFVDYEFPTSEHLQEYLESITSRDDDEIKKLIRFFCIPSGSLGHDSWLLKSLSLTDQLLPFVKRFEFGRRMFSGKPWEGMTWILDLLPAWPKEAVSAVDSYILAHAQFLPDGRLRGLGEVSQIINAKYLDKIEPQEVLTDLDPRQFELLIANLYRRLGFSVSVTPKQKDGGFDIVAEKALGQSEERLLVECKKYVDNVGVRIIRQLLGVLDTEGATRGVLVTTAGFTKAAKNLAIQSKRIELVGHKELCVRLNRHVGPFWVSDLKSIVSRELANTESTGR